MPDVALEVTVEAEKLFTAITAPLESVGLAELPTIIKGLAATLVALPPVQAFITKEETAAATAIGSLAGRLATEFTDLATKLAKEHPVLAELWDKIEPVVAPVIKPVIEGLADDVVAKIAKYQGTGNLGAVIAAGEKALGLVS